MGMTADAALPKEHRDDVSSGEGSHSR